MNTASTLGQRRSAVVSTAGMSVALVESWRPSVMAGLLAELAGPDDEQRATWRRQNLSWNLVWSGLGTGAAAIAVTVVFIQAVIHHATVTVDEEGTEAAAATGVAVGVTAAPARPVIFRADHPFLFLIRDTSTDTILFIGRLAVP